MKYLFVPLFSCIISSVFAQQKLDVEGHRGGRALMPENTIPTMLHAVDLGVKTLELDCVISEDKQVVVSHDVYMSSDFMLKPDGSLISKAEEKQFLLYRMPYDSIRRFDAGTKPHPQFPEQKKMKTYKPLLSTLIDSVEQYVKAHHLKAVYYNVEIKSSPAADDIAHPQPAAFVKLVMDVLKKKGVQKRVIIQSFDTRPLVLLHQKYPKQPLSYLVQNKDNFDDNIKKLGFSPAVISPNYALIDADFVKNAHQSNVKVIPWTVNDEASMQKMAEWQVDGIISDYPDKLVNLFGSFQDQIK
ncbi:glycerophosphodiester phosphodiesterase family protein [Mucilaginibacter lappiensis]|jgi:glycerophosphoryl diester phosphodiesterase|uniref:glycerophosphodiester phosphodiesterase family protein n=1 Tax=Mucilaginibacter lappiensis TaxID=354630 RepID=UPI003D1B4C1F